MLEASLALLICMQGKAGPGWTQDWAGFSRGQITYYVLAVLAQGNHNKDLSLHDLNNRHLFLTDGDWEVPDQGTSRLHSW